MKKNKSNFESLGLQKVFIISLILSLLVSVFYYIYLAVSQYSSNTNLSSFVVVFIGMGAPILFFLTAYFMHKPAEVKTKVFDSVLIAVAGLAIYGAISTLSSILFQSTMIFAESFSSFIYYELATVVFVLVLLYLFICYLKRAKKW